MKSPWKEENKFLSLGFINKFGSIYYPKHNLTSPTDDFADRLFIQALRLASNIWVDMQKLHELIIELRHNGIEYLMSCADTGHDVWRT